MKREAKGGTPPHGPPQKQEYNDYWGLCGKSRLSLLATHGTAAIHIQTSEQAKTSADSANETR